jgi:hypothetical protein
MHYMDRHAVMCFHPSTGPWYTVDRSLGLSHIGKLIKMLELPQKKMHAGKERLLGL